MFIDMMRWEVKPERWDEAVTLLRVEAVPTIEREPGFLRVLVVGDDLSGEGVTLTLWRAEDDARVFARSGRSAGELRALAELFGAPPQTLGYPMLLDRAA